MRSHPRTDKNHAEIVAAFRHAKCQVQSLASIGGGCPDLLVGIAGHSVLVEIKSPQGKLTPDQKTWIEAWTGGNVFLIHDLDELERLVRFWRAS
jgi:hypothetical protein